MSTIQTSTHSQDELIRQALLELSSWNASEIEAAKEFDRLLEIMSDLTDQMGDLEKNKEDLQKQLDQATRTLKDLKEELKRLEKQGGTPEEISAVKGKITSLQSRIATLSSQLHDIASSIDKTKKVLDITQKTLSEIAETLGKHSDLANLYTYAQALNARKNQEELQRSKESSSQRYRETSQKAIDDYAHNIKLISNEIQATFEDIKDKQKIVDDATMKEKKAKNDLIKDLLVGILCPVLGLIGGIFSIFGYSKDAKAKAAAKNALANDQQILVQDFATLKNLNKAPLKDLLDELDTILANISSHEGTGKENDLQSAATALVQALQILQLFLSKTHQKRNEDDQYMEQSSTINYEETSHRINDEYKSFNDNLFYAHFMKALIKVGQIALIVGSIAAASITGGSSLIAFTAISAICSGLSMLSDGKIDPLGALSSLIAKGLNNSMGGDKHGWTKVVGDVAVALTIAAVCLVVAKSTAGVSSAAGELVGEEAAANVNHVAHIAEQEAGEELVINEADEAEGSFIEAAPNPGVAANQVQSPPTGMLSSKLRQFFIFLAASSALTNTLGDSARAIGEAFAKDSKLDESTLFQVIEGITQVLQAIIALLAMHSMMQGPDGKLSPKVNEWVEKFSTQSSLFKYNALVNSVGMGIGAVGQAGMIPETLRKTDVLQTLGSEQFLVTIIKALSEGVQKDEKLESQEFSQMIQAMASSTKEFADRSALAEKEAARCLLERAV